MYILIFIAKIPHTKQTSASVLQFLAILGFTFSCHVTNIFKYSVDIHYLWQYIQVLNLPGPVPNRWAFFITINSITVTFDRRTKPTHIFVAEQHCYC